MTEATGPVYLVQQGANLRAVISLAARHHRGHDLAGVGIHTEVQLLPQDRRVRVPCFSINHSPGPTQLQARAVHQQMHRLGLAP